MMDFSIEADAAIEAFIDELVSRMSDIIGSGEIISGCEVLDMNPDGDSPAVPRWITARINEFSQQRNVQYRGFPPGVVVGDFVTVAHMREANRYEVIGASGAGGVVLSLELYDENPNVAFTAPAATGNLAVAIGDYAAAGGNWSFVGGGYYNTALGSFDVVAGGYRNTASGYYSGVFGGYCNQATNPMAAVCGGGRNTASGFYSSVLGGYYSIASGNYSAVLGGMRGLANKHGQRAFASGRFSANGDAQGSLLVARAQTTNAVQTEMFLDGAAARCTIASDTTWLFRVGVVARRTDSDGESAGWVFWGLIDNNAGTTALAGDGVFNQPFVQKDDADWEVDVDADDANDALRIRVTGEAGKTINWVATIWLAEVTG